MAEIQVRAKQTASSAQLQGGILQMNVVNPIGEFAQKVDRIDQLPDKVAGIKIKTK